MLYSYWCKEGIAMSDKTSKKNKKKKYSSRVERNKNIYYKNISSPAPVKKNNSNKKYLVILAISIILNSVLLLMINNRNNSIDELKNSIEDNKQTYEKEVEDIKEGYTNYLFLGDSITEYYDLDKYFPDMPVVNSGIAGDTTEEILNDMKGRVYDYNPSKVFILIGTNDLRDDKSVEEVVENIKKIIEEIKQNRKIAEVYLESIYPVNKGINKSVVGLRDNDDINEINSQIEEYAKNEGVTFLNTHELLVDDDGLLNEDYTADGLHLNDKGYEVVTEEIMEYLEV